MVTKTRTRIIIDREEEFAERAFTAHAVARTRYRSHALVISTAYHDVPETNYVIAIINETRGVPWMASQANARVRSLLQRRDSSTSVARDASPWYAACSRVGSLYKRPARRRFTVMDNSKASEGIFQWAPLWLGIIYVSKRKKEICRKNMYIFHVYI